jgi:prevent-host-death family protein
MDMMKTSATQFKAKLGQYMRAVRAGNEVVVTDRDQPVARLIPFRAEPAPALATAAAADVGAPPLGKLRVRGISYRGPGTTELLRRDRDRR